METTSSLGFGHFIAQTDALGRTLLVLLLLMSLACWALVAFKGYAQWRRQRRATAFLAGFWNAPTLDAVQHELTTHGAHEPFAHRPPTRCTPSSTMRAMARRGWPTPAARPTSSPARSARCWTRRPPGWKAA